MHNSELIKNLSQSVPRYTSYPTAPHFEAGIGPELLTELHNSIDGSQRISLYIHIPYCDRLCWFCGCNTKQTKSYKPVADYVATLIKEIKLHREKISVRPALAHVHLGGGSPSMLNSQDLRRLSDELRYSFIIDDQTEVSVELDPVDMCDDTYEGLKYLGVTRASIGVQDFDPDVQAAINRPQSFEETKELVRNLRSMGIKSINIDALYGLPRQNMARLKSTVQKVISLAPDRVAMFGYAHVPWVKKHQKMIKDSDLPDSNERFAQSECAKTLLKDAGYIGIGIDHFAKPQDSLARAASEGRLRRNFQGYTTDTCEVMLGIGGSSIGRFGGGYIQNFVPTNLYRNKIENGELAGGKGYRFCADDKIRAEIIEKLMCSFEFSLDGLSQKFGSPADEMIAEAKSLAENDPLGLVECSDKIFSIKPDHKIATRIVASWFDAYLSNKEFGYSKAI